MTSFQRMIVIPQEEYVALSSMQNVREPLTSHFHSLERRYIDEEKEQDPYRRVIMQGNTLEQLKQIKDQMRNSLVIATPKPYQNRAKALFQSLENVLKFNDKGEIYDDAGTLLAGSRLEDLIQHAVRDRRRNMTPIGWKEFLSLLHVHNVPKSMLNRNTLDEMEGELTHSHTMKRKMSSPPHTPSKQRKVSTPTKHSIKATSRSQPERKVKPEPSSFTTSNIKKKKDLNFLKTYKHE